MNDDLRCCGSGTCMINAKGVCWCGQRWDGDTMCATPLQQNATDDQPMALTPVQQSPVPRPHER
jgi:hypothetical protein